MNIYIYFYTFKPTKDMSKSVYISQCKESSEKLYTLSKKYCTETQVELFDGNIGYIVDSLVKISRPCNQYTTKGVQITGEIRGEFEGANKMVLISIGEEEEDALQKMIEIREKGSPIEFLDLSKYIDDCAFVAGTNKEVKETWAGVVGHI